MRGARAPRTQGTRSVERSAPLFAVALLLAACGSPSVGGSSSGATVIPSAAGTAASTPLDGGTASSTTDQSIGLPRTTLDLTALPLGNQKFSTSAPAAGSVYLCHSMQGGPPVHAKPWVNTSAGTWNLKAKVAVAGDVTHNAQFSATQSGTSEVLTGNGLPPRSGVFPVASTDPADAYDPDPNSVATDAINVTLPYDPVAAATPTCIGGVVGVMSDGISMFNAFDAGGNDAGAMEVQDTCHGHPNQTGYHYHALSPCLLTASARTTTTQVGWAFDGYGMYVEYASSGNLLTNASLDACHGRTSVVPWHGELVSMYHYDLTIEFPYSVACYHGTPISTAASGGLTGP